MIRSYRLPETADFHAFCVALNEPLQAYRLGTKPSPRGASIQAGATEVGTVKYAGNRAFVFLRAPYESVLDAIDSFVKKRYTGQQ